jgi:16S rRNA G966 N2-methylase RsmD
MEELFPLKDGVDYSNLQITDEGKYSITKRKDAERIINILKNVIKDIQTKTITDATGCIGGDTINFSLNFNTVHSIEINEENYNALVNNVKVYEVKNVFIQKGNAVELFNWYSDVLYVDPPWGGPDYRNKQNLDLYMSSKRIDQWFEEILLRKNRPRYLVLKLPHNYNFKRFNFLSNVEYIKPYRVRGYVLVIITVHMPRSIQ